MVYLFLNHQLFSKLPSKFIASNEYRKLREHLVQKLICLFSATITINSSKFRLLTCFEILLGDVHLGIKLSAEGAICCADHRSRGVHNASHSIEAFGKAIPVASSGLHSSI
jgi:hypothetical protein